MAVIIIFALGYIIGGGSALLLIGLTFINRNYRNQDSRRRPIELSHDAESYGI